MYDNICRFVPFHKDVDSIHTINYVYETKQQSYTMLKIESICKMYIVSGGKGKIHTRGAIFELSEGDIFFTLPAEPFCIESISEFTYMYISFVGTRGYELISKLGISCSKFIFRDFSDLIPLWKNGLSTCEEYTDIVSESVLLYTFSAIGNRFHTDCKDAKNIIYIASVAKKYIDDNLTDPYLTLDSVSKKFNYNPKYLSTVFKKAVGIGFREYLSMIRIQYACTMMQHGYTSINDISRMCGYSDSHYFSNVFKKRIGLSPTQYI